MNSYINETCRFCAEPIPSAAKLCPHCRQWLTYRSLRNPVIFFWLHFVPSLSLYILLMTGLLNRMNPGPFYSEFPDSLQVLQSKMNWLQTSNIHRIYFTGILTNQSKVAWKNIEFECRFFDGRGSMIDAVHPDGFFTAQAKDDTAFSFTVKPALATNDYASYKLSVSSARNAKSMF